jgi:hypothetical protein
MLSIGTGDARELLQAAVTAVSVLGGAMAYTSGHFAASALAERQPPDALSRRINEGIGLGFIAGWPIATVALIIEIWS